MTCPLVGTAPTLTYYVGGGNVPQTSPDVDNFGDRVFGWVKPDVGGDYTFFPATVGGSYEFYLNPTAAGSGTNTLPDVQVDTLRAFYYGGAASAFTEPPSARTASG